MKSTHGSVVPLAMFLGKKEYFYIIFHFTSSILKFFVAGVKHCIDAFEEIFLKVYKHEVQKKSAQRHSFAELLLVLSNQPSEIKHSYICWHYLCKHTLVVVEWLFCVIFPNLKNLQGINQQYWFVTGSLELLYSRSGRITSLDQSLVDRNTAQCTFTHSAIDIENHQTRMGGKTHSIKFFSHGPPLKVSIHHHFIRAKIQIWKMGILPIKMTEDKHNHIKSYGISVS